MTVNEESMNPADEPVVLVVEDEPDVAETYKLWLAADYDVRLAESGDAALGMIDETVDIVLLDRMMPGMSGTEVLAKIRDRGYDCRVAMVSAVDPDFDIIEMGFDDYVTKPPTRDGLLETVEELGERGQRAERVQEYRSLLAKQAALETQKTEDELEASEGVQPTAGATRVGPDRPRVGAGSIARRRRIRGLSARSRRRNDE